MTNYQLICGTIIMVCLLVWIYWLSHKYRQLEKRFNLALGKNTSGADLESTLVAYFDKLNITESKLAQMRRQTDNLQRLAARSYQKIGLIRFNPFRDTGGDQSFVLCLLDNQDNGLILTAVHSRQGTRIYAKTIEYGQSSSQLSEEEGRALHSAMRQKRPSSA